MADVPVVLRAQSVSLLLIEHRAIVLDQFLAVRIARRKLGASGFKPNGPACRSYRARFVATSLLSVAK